eukprot:6181890-Pleurochrysis_carterae.AAC.2
MKLLALSLPISHVRGTTGNEARVRRAGCVCTSCVSCVGKGAGVVRPWWRQGSAKSSEAPARWATERPTTKATAAHTPPSSIVSKPAARGGIRDTRGKTDRKEERGQYARQPLSTHDAVRRLGTFDSDGTKPSGTRRSWVKRAGLQLTEAEMEELDKD